MTDTSRRSALGLLAAPLLAAPAMAAQATTPTGASRVGHLIDPDDWGGLRRYTDANRELLASGGRCDIVFIGDSITEGWPDKRPNFFSAGRIGRGIGGQTTLQILTRMMADVVRLRRTTVHFMGGTNDVAGNTGSIDAEQTRDAVQAMIAIARQHNIRVLLGLIRPAAHFPWRPGLAARAEIAASNREELYKV